MLTERDKNIVSIATDLCSAVEVWIERGAHPIFLQTMQDVANTDDSEELTRVFARRKETLALMARFINELYTLSIEVEKSKDELRRLKVFLKAFLALAREAMTRES